jgi:hypothetical protein
MKFDSGAQKRPPERWGPRGAKDAFLFRERLDDPCPLADFARKRLPKRTGNLHAAGTLPGRRAALYVDQPLFIVFLCNLPELPESRLPRFRRSFEPVPVANARRENMRIHHSGQGRFQGDLGARFAVRADDVSDDNRLLKHLRVRPGCPFALRPKPPSLAAPKKSKAKVHPVTPGWSEIGG